MCDTFQIGIPCNKLKCIWGSDLLWTLSGDLEKFVFISKDL